MKMAVELAACCGVPPYTPDTLMEIEVSETSVRAFLPPEFARPRREADDECAGAERGEIGADDRARAFICDIGEETHGAEKNHEADRRPAPQIAGGLVSGTRFGRLGTRHFASG